MKDTVESLRRKIESTKDLESVVRTMKALAASSIIQYENAVGSLNFYYRTVELGLALSFRRAKEIPTQENLNKKKPETSAIIVFGSDLGLVGQERFVQQTDSARHAHRPSLLGKDELRVKFMG